MALLAEDFGVVEAISAITALVVDFQVALRCATSHVSLLALDVLGVVAVAV